MPLTKNEIIASSKDFDVIVVGDGPAGLIAARKLAQENPYKKIAIICLERSAGRTQHIVYPDPDKLNQKKSYHLITGGSIFDKMPSSIKHLEKQLKNHTKSKYKNISFLTTKDKFDANDIRALQTEHIVLATGTNTQVSEELGFQYEKFLPESSFKARCDAKHLSLQIKIDSNQLAEINKLIRVHGKYTFDVYIRKHESRRNKGKISISMSIPMVNKKERYEKIDCHKDESLTEIEMRDYIKMIFIEAGINENLINNILEKAKIGQFKIDLKQASQSYIEINSDDGKQKYIHLVGELYKTSNYLLGEGIRKAYVNAIRLNRTYQALVEIKNAGKNKQHCDQTKDTLNVLTDPPKIMEDIHFNALLINLNEKRKKFKNKLKNNMSRVEKENYELAYDAIRQLLEKLEDTKNTFLRTGDRIAFKEGCLQAVDAAKPILSRHREWNQTLVNIVSVACAIMTLGVSLLLHQRYGLFKTSSQKLLDKMKVHLEDHPVLKESRI